IGDPEKDHDFRVAHLRAMVYLPNLGEDIIKLLIRLLDDQSVAIRSHAAWILAEQGPRAESAIPTLVKKLNDSTFDQAMNYSIFPPDSAVCEALVRIGSKAIPALVESLKEKSRRDRAVIALGRLGPRAKIAIPALRELLPGPPKRTSVLAAIALLHIGESPKE